MISTSLAFKVTALPRTNWTVTSLDEESKSLVRTATESHWYTSRPFASLMAALLGIIGTITGYTLRTRADLKKDRQLANAVVRTITSEVDIWFEYLKKGIAGDVERLGPDEALRIRFQLQQNFFVIFDSNAGSLSKAGKDTCSHVIQIYMRGKSLFEYLAINNRLLDDPNANPRVLQKHAEFIKDIWANLKQDYAKLKTVVIQ